MGKTMWTNPVAVVEQFVSNEYISACYDYTVSLSCAIPGRSSSYVHDGTTARNNHGICANTATFDVSGSRGFEVTNGSVNQLRPSLILFSVLKLTLIPQVASQLTLVTGLSNLKMVVTIGLHGPAQIWRITRVTIITMALPMLLVPMLILTDRTILNLLDQLPFGQGVGRLFSD